VRTINVRKRTNEPGSNRRVKSEATTHGGVFRRDEMKKGKTMERYGVHNRGVGG